MMVWSIICNGGMINNTHTCLSNLKFVYNTCLTLKNVLHAPLISTKIISVNKLCNDNHIFVHIINFSFLKTLFRKRLCFKNLLVITCASLVLALLGILLALRLPFLLKFSYGMIFLLMYLMISYKKLLKFSE